MKTSQRGVALIKQFEGLELEAYQDIAGIWTIGYGHTGADVKPGQIITEAEAEAILKRDLGPREQAVSRLSKVELNQNEFDALVSFVYNVGENAYKGSTARRRLNSGDRLGAAEALTWWNKATVGGVLRPVAGLTRRRAAERALFLTPTNPAIVRDQDDISENSRVTPIEDSPRRSNLSESRTIQGATVAGGAGVASTSMGRRDTQELETMQHQHEGGDDDLDFIDDDLTPPDTNDGDTTAPETGDGEPDTSATDNSETPTDGGATDSDATDTDEPSEGAEDTPQETEDSVSVDDDLTELVILGEEHPTLREQHAADAQIQLALMVLILLSVAFLIFTRIDDWFNYRR